MACLNSRQEFGSPDGRRREAGARRLWLSTRFVMLGCGWSLDHAAPARAIPAAITGAVHRAASFERGPVFSQYVKRTGDRGATALVPPSPLRPRGQGLYRRSHQAFWIALAL
jgi:hypothetical protein